MTMYHDCLIDNACPNSFSPSATNFSNYIFKTEKSDGMNVLGILVFSIVFGVVIQCKP